MKWSAPDEGHKEIYRTLGVPPEVMKPVRTWTRFEKATIVTEKGPKSAKSREAK